LVIASLGIAREASASPSARLLYVRNVGAESCPDESALRKSVAVRLGYDPFFPWATTTVLATIDRAGTGYRAEISILDEHSAVLGRRALVTRGEDCSELTTTIGLAVSVALDDLDLGTKAPATTAPVATPAPLASPVTHAGNLTRVEAPTAQPAPQRLPEPRRTLSIAAGPVASVGVAPRPSFGGAVSLQGRWGWLSVQVDGRADAPTSGVYRGVLVATYIVGASPAACVHASWGGYACGVGFLGRLSAQGTRTDEAFYSAVGGRVGAQLTLGGPFFVDVHADGLGKLTGDAVAVDGTPVFSPFPFTASLAGWVSARF
jgi:hypothetical protein